MGLALQSSDIVIVNKNKEKMSDYVSIQEFNQGWNFFIKKINHGPHKMWGKFPCSEFSCSGCDDWLDADNQNRNDDKL